MKRVNDYYRDLWLQKSGSRPYQGKDPDRLHALFLNILLDPKRNSRADVGRELIGNTGGTCLDIGCWGGESAEAMGMLDPKWEAYGLDLLPESIARAQSRGMRAVQCDLNEESIPFPAGKFDVVTCLAVLGQLFDPLFALSEIHRVLKPGGRLILNVPNVASLSNRVRLLFGRAPVTSRDPGWDGGQLHYFTKRTTIWALEQTGFNVARVCATGGGRALRELWPSLLSGTLTFKAVKP